MKLNKHTEVIFTAKVILTESSKNLTTNSCIDVIPQWLKLERSCIRLRHMDGVHINQHSVFMWRYEG